jgi:ketosteroid isomerase-like protein
MPAHSADEVHRLWAEAFSAKELDTLISLYEPEATLVPSVDGPVSGHAAIRDVLEGFLAMAKTFTLHPGTIIYSNEIALVHANWTLDGTGEGGQPVALSGRTADVVRRQADGTWLIVVDDPFGGSGGPS